MRWGWGNLDAKDYSAYREVIIIRKKGSFKRQENKVPTNVVIVIIYRL